MSKPKKSAGRPAGAETKDRAVVTQTITLQRCPACGCESAPQNKRLLRSGNATATINGTLVGSYKHFTANCAKCGKALLVKEYRAVK